MGARPPPPLASLAPLSLSLDGGVFDVFGVNVQTIAVATQQVERREVKCAPEGIHSTFMCNFT